MREAGTVPMIVVDCAACADERAAGAAFCEACGRALDGTAGAGSEPAAGGEPAGRGEPACSEPAAGGEPAGRGEPAGEIGGSAPSQTGDRGGTLGSDGDRDASSRRRRGCPHCGATRAVAADGYCEECGMLAGRPRDHIEADGGAVAAAVSDRGRRHRRNEDAMWLAVGDAAADVVVCDGVSASFDPDAASDIAARTAGELLAAAQHADPDAPADAAAGPAATGDRDGSEPDDEPGTATAPVAIAGVVAAAIAGAAEAVVSLAHTGDPRRAASNPACTIVAAAVRGPHVGFGWVGDSRAYWLGADGPAEQLTEDDSWATHMIALGTDPIAAMDDPRAHAITAWLGADAGPILPRVGAFTAAGDGLLVLCSDGLWNYLPDPAAFADTVRGCLAGRTLLEAARALITFANTAGGADNITVALVPVHAADES